MHDLLFPSQKYSYPLATFIYGIIDSLIFEKVSAHQVLAVLASRTNDAKAREFVKKKYNRSHNRTLRLRFNLLGNSEETVASTFQTGDITFLITHYVGFSCLQQTPVFSFVQLFITSTCVCWSASLSNYRQVVPLTSIFNVKMEDDIALSFVSNEPLV